MLRPQQSFQLGLPVTFTQLATAALLLATSLAAPAAAAPFLIDGNDAPVEGDCTFACTARYQQVYDNALFTGGPVTINSIAFFSSYDWNWNASTFQLSIGIANGSTTAGLSSTFASNILSPTVFGNLIVTQGQAQAAGSLFGFNGSFVYDPSLGDLIIDIRRTAGGSSYVASRYNPMNGYEFSRVYSFADAPSGVAQYDYGNVTLFDISPVAGDAAAGRPV